MLPPRVEFKPIEGYSLAADADLTDEGANLGIKAIPVHAEVSWGVSESEHPDGCEE